MSEGFLSGQKAIAEAGFFNKTRVSIETRRQAVATGAENAGAFWTQYVDTATGDTYLQGGSVTGGNGGSHTFADYMVLDSTLGVDTHEGDILYVKVSCEATVADGVMLPGCLVVAGSDWGFDTPAIPANHSFTTVAATGDIYREIGRWTDVAFLPSGPPGNLSAGGCIGGFLISVV